MAYGEKSPGQCVRERQPQHLRSGEGVLWVPWKVCVGVGAAARVCGSVRAAYSVQHAAAAGCWHRQMAAECVVRAC